ncbi:hypothetical protein MLD38_022337 [Melastoma candidum]|uniref:Uncharacterized protein n=1 Tax=Melastoma candidum TaxID=119954 RepID=A0ACB9QI88_9MYRT|nr:hypothetical protein MLD38_022337 [Melastoma candidum]
MGPLLPMGIFWDIKSCGIPEDVNPQYLVTNVLSVLSDHLPNHYPELFYAYGDAGDIPTHLLSLWKDEHGFTLHHVRPDVGLGVQMLTDMMVDLAMKYPYPLPSALVVISGDSRLESFIYGFGVTGYNAVLIRHFTGPVPEHRARPIKCLDWASAAGGLGR